MTNFEQRWRKAAKWRDFRLKKVTHWHEDALIKLDRISWIITPSPGPTDDHAVRVTTEDDPENWHVQGQKNQVILKINYLLILPIWRRKNKKDCRF